MSDKTKICATVVLMLFAATSATAKQLKLDESPVGPGEWGYRPDLGTVSAVNPPAFSWRPQGKLTWQLQCSADAQFASGVYNVEQLEFSVHCPGEVFGDGKYYWRYRGKDENGQYSNWSKVRHFTIAADAAHMPMPQRSELISRIPKTHPRLFTRPEKVGHLRQLAKGKLKPKYDALARQCERLLKNPPATDEPPKYGDDIVINSDPWREIWWGNRKYVIKTLDGAATLGFAYLLDGNAKYGNEARRILMECAKWDPVGSTGYRYNDEVGMPYAYYFSRTYTFINDLLSDEEKALCRKVMKVRGDEMYKHLCPRHLWRPYGSHANRAWHFLGEVGIAFLDEIDGADDWVWFAMNVFYNVYPVWCDDDGGWHEGAGYWSSYQGRFTWWADIMREAFGVNAFDKPYYSRAGYYAMYLMPPGKVGGGFGDLVAKRTARSNRGIVSIFAAQAQNSHWRWYVDQLGGPSETGGYIGFVRGALPQVEATPPDDLANSRLFEGIGQAYLNTNITDASESVQVAFKSSPFGTQSHGYEANNSFLLWGYGKRLLIRSGYRDSYGSDHHKNWMWSTRSVNNITVNGKGQYRRASKAIGEITDFKTTPSIDIVVGEAAQAYQVDLERFTRAIIFVKPELVIVYDRLRAKAPSTYEYRLHAINEIDVKDQHSVQVTNDDVLCDIDFLAPAGLSFTQTNQYDPNPRPRITLREWHLTAATVEKKKQMEFVTLYRVHRSKDPIPTYAELRTIKGGYALQARTSSGEVAVLLPTDDSADLRAFGLTSKGAIKVRLIRNKCGIETLGLDSPDAGAKSLEPDFPLVDFHVHLKGGLTSEDMFTPKPHDQKPIFTKGLLKN